MESEESRYDGDTSPTRLEADVGGAEVREPFGIASLDCHNVKLPLEERRLTVTAKDDATLRVPTYNLITGGMICKLMRFTT